jgi:predicted Rdx family selenoprotein
MASDIFEEFGQRFSVDLIPSKGGVFEVAVGGDLVYSKKATRRHAEYETDIAPGLRSLAN